MEPSTHHDHERFMRMAMDEAATAARDGNTPYGAVLVDPDGAVAATGRNQTVEEHDPSSHAEMNVIRQACRERETLSLAGYRIYASGQPCPMCSTAIIRTGISEVYYAAPAAPGAALISPEELVERSGSRQTRVISGILAEEALDLMARLIEEQAGDR